MLGRAKIINFKTFLLLFSFLILSSCGGGDNTTLPNSPDTQKTNKLSIIFDSTNTGTGSVTLSPSDIVCKVDCTESFKTGVKVTLTNKADPGSSFKGYDGNPDCLDDVVTVDSEIICKPLFELNSNAVSYKLNITLAGFGVVISDPAGIDCGSACSKSFFEGSTIKLTATPADGNKFVSWSGTGCNTDTITMNADVNCVVTFEPIKTDVNLTINFAGGGSGSVNSSFPVGAVCNNAPCITTHALDSKVTLTAKPAIDSDFAGWSVDCNSNNANPVTIVTMSAVKACTATFELKPVVITTHNLAINLAGSASNKGLVTSNPSGIKCGGGGACTKDFVEGKVVTLTAEPTDATSTFVRWDSFCSGSAKKTSVTMDTAKDCTAIFDLIPVVTHELTIIKVGSGIITSKLIGIDCGTTCKKIYDANTKVTLIATEAAGYIFKGWTGVGCTTGIVTMDSSKSCTATFVVKPVLTTLRLNKIGGKGTITAISRNGTTRYDCPESQIVCPMDFPVGDIVDITAKGLGGDIFVGVNGDCQIIGGQPTITPIGISATMSGLMFCNITFDTALNTANHHSITFQHLGTGKGFLLANVPSISCGESCFRYPVNASASIYIQLTSGSSFVGWGGSCSATNGGLNPNLTLSITMLRNYACTVTIN